MESEKVYHDSKGWRKLNPHPQFVLHGQYNEINPAWIQFEQSITYHPFPNEPNVKPGEVVMAYLQWQFECQIGVNEGKWLNGSKDNIEYLKGEGFITRQIWVAANQSHQEGKEEQAKDFGNDNHLYNCPFCNGSEKDRIVMLGYKYPKYRVSCCDCGYFIEDDRKDKVLELWNTRNGKGWLESSLSPSAQKVQKPAKQKEETSKIDNIFEETVEQAAIRYMMVTDLPYDGENDYIIGFTKGANWATSSLQQENDRLGAESDRLRNLNRKHEQQIIAIGQFCAAEKIKHPETAELLNRILELSR